MRTRLVQLTRFVDVNDANKDVNNNNINIHNNHIINKYTRSEVRCSFSFIQSDILPTCKLISFFIVLLSV